VTLLFAFKNQSLKAKRNSRSEERNEANGIKNKGEARACITLVFLWNEARESTADTPYNCLCMPKDAQICAVEIKD
jgi:hypothetical protein